MFSSTRHVQHVLQALKMRIRFTARNCWRVTHVEFSDTAQRSPIFSSDHVDRQKCQADDWQLHHRKECKYLQRESTVPEVLTRGVLRLVNLLSGEGENGPFAQDVSKLVSHIQRFKQNSKWWQGITQTTNNIKRISAAGGKPLDAAGVKRVEQLICKV